jgi:AraC family transcriptional regulator, regulatory protein of adaptative response / DNA-3-methyladenine glycosylase II
MLALGDEPLDRTLTSGDAASNAIRLCLAYRPPLDWDRLLAFLSARATPGIEAVDAGGRYWRSIQL